MTILRRFTHPFDNHANRVVITGFQVLAITMTIARLARRIRISRCSWDDAWAAVSLVIFSVQTGFDWVTMEAREDRKTMEPLVYQRKSSQFMSLVIGLFTAVVWTSRISLSLSIARILPPSRLRQTALMTSVACFIFGSVITPMKSALCVLDYSGKHKNGMTCRGGNAILITQVAGDIISSAILIIFPLHALRITSANERGLIYLLVMGTMLTLGACLAQSFYVIKSDPYGMTYSAKLEGAITLMVCNLLVVVTSIYRLCSRNQPEEYNSGEKSITIVTAGDWNDSASALSSLDTVSTGFPSQLTELNESLPTLSLHSVDLNVPPESARRPDPEVVVLTRTSYTQNV